MGRRDLVLLALAGCGRLGFGDGASAEYVFIDDSRETFDRGQYDVGSALLTYRDGRVELAQALPVDPANVGIYMSRPFDTHDDGAIWDTLPIAPAGRPLAGDGGSDAGYAEGGVGMSDNTILLHFDGVGSVANTALLRDGSGLQHDGRMVQTGQGARFVEGVFGQALDIDRDAWVTLDYRYFDLGVGDYTFAIWVKQYDCTQSNDNRIAIGGGANDMPHIWLGAACPDSCGGTNDVATMVWLDDTRTGTSIDVCTTVVQQDGSWHHLASVKQGHAPASLRLYVDGREVATKSHDYGQATHTYTGGEVRIGGFNLGGTQYNTRITVDETAVWKRALSAADIAALLPARRGSARAAAAQLSRRDVRYRDLRRSRRHDHHVLHGERARGRGRRAAWQPRFARAVRPGRAVSRTVLDLDAERLAGAGPRATRGPQTIVVLGHDGGMSYDQQKRGVGGGSAGGMQAQHGVAGKQSLVDTTYGEHDEDLLDAPRESGGGGTLESPRFSDDAELTAAAEGKKTFTSGASGVHVRKVQRALAELGHLAQDKVTGTIDAAAETALKAFQKSKTIGESGAIDKDTMTALDTAFAGHAVEGGILKGIKPSTMPTEDKPYDVGKAPKELTDGTHALTDAERDAFNAAISTETKKVGGVLPTFTETVGGENYGDKLEAAITKVVDKQLVRAKDMEKDRGAGHLYDWADIEKVGVESKKATDAQFGIYAQGKALKATGVDAKIKDAWEHKEKKFKADPAEEDAAARWRVNKILQGHDSISTIDTAHGAVQSRAAEKAIVDKVRAKIVAARKADLVLIHKAWPAFADGDDVFIQRVQNHDDKGGFDKAEGRNYMWKTFQTIIHEYIHTLEHPEHVKYRETLGAQKGGFTLREGTTDYFTKIAYNNTNKSDPTLRHNVEGPFHEKGKTHPVPDLTTYRESANAERAAGIVGIRNLCAGFFLGRVDLIGKK